MAAWQVIPVNGAFADALVVDFGGIIAANTSLPPDSKLCLELDYSSAAASQVVLYLAPPTNLVQQRIMIYDSALQTVPAANSTQYLTGVCVDVPIRSGVLQPYGLYLTKPAGAANLTIYTTPKMGPGC